MRPGRSVEASVAALGSFRQQEATRLEAAAAEDWQRTAAVFGLLLLVTAFLGLWISRSIRLQVHSAQKVDAGTRLVDAAGQTMQEIVGSVEKVTALVSEIAAASAEQSSGIAQVNTAMNQMDRVVQQNASLVEEAAAATESLEDRVGALLKMVARFRLAGDAQPPASPAAAGG